MAGRRGQRQARDLIQAARFADDTARGLWRVHRKVCARCDHADMPARECCDEGWQLLKEATNTGNKLRTLRELDAARRRQMTLW